MTAELWNPENATIFCGVKSVRRLTALAERWAVAVEEDRASGRITVRTSDGSIVMTPWTFDVPGGDFAKTILGADNAIDRGAELVLGGKAEVSPTVGRCRLMLGLRFLPALVADDLRIEVIHDVAALHRGHIFDGLFFRRASGEPLVEVSVSGSLGDW